MKIFVVENNDTISSTNVTQRTLKSLAIRIFSLYVNIVK